MFSLADYDISPHPHTPPHTHIHSLAILPPRLYSFYTLGAIQKSIQRRKKSSFSLSTKALKERIVNVCMVLFLQTVMELQYKCNPLLYYESENAVDPILCPILSHLPCAALGAALLLFTCAHKHTNYPVSRFLLTEEQ